MRVGKRVTQCIFKGRDDEANMRIFISYRRAEDDRTYLVGQIHERLASVFGGENVFRDISAIHGGDDWRAILGREIHSCKVMLVVIGPDWATLADAAGHRRLLDPDDVTRWEVETGLLRSRAGQAVVIPLLVLEAQIPRQGDLPESLWPLLEKNGVRLRNYPDFQRDFETLVQDIRLSLGYASDDITVEPYEPETICIAGGPFWMGCRPVENIPHYETPLHEASLPDFRIGMYPVTNKQYEVFVAEARIEVPRQLGWEGQRVPGGREKYPVTGVTWYDALAYCQWLSRKTGRSYSLPSEAQWEKACRGGNACLYPWGDEFDPSRCNQGRGGVASVDSCPAQNDFGLFDLVGNLRQWTCTLWEQGDSPQPSPYPWREDGRNDLNAGSETPRVLRGGAVQDPPLQQRCSVRRGDYPESRGFVGARYGFRVVMKI
jgi:formylglycine-generating enzyme required for sulfatase activity